MGKKPVEQGKAPVILESSLSFSNFFLVFLAVFVAGVSYLSGAAPAQILLRTGTSILVVGLLLWVFNWRLISNLIQAAQNDRAQEPQSGLAENTTTQEVEA